MYLDDSTPDAKRRRKLSRFETIFIGTVVVLNALAVSFAAKDASFGALAIAVFYGPMLNIVLTVLSVSASPLLKKYLLRFSFNRHVMISIFVPTAAAVMDFAIIISMDLHGC